jgi:uncharacterized delta-60 repeat protein
MSAHERRRMLALLAAGVVVCVAGVDAAVPCEEPNLDWLDLFTGPGTNILQEGLDIALDPDGNVVVTGNAFLTSFRSSYGTLKYSPEGELLWHRYYLLDVNQSSYASALVIDDDGNIYVTGEGRETDPEPFSPFKTFAVTLKYSPDGTLLWEHVHEAPPSNSTLGRGIAIGPDGNIVVVGAAQVGQPAFQSFAVKIDPDGNTVWAREFTIPSHNWTVLTSIAIDPDGFISLGGTSGIVIGLGADIHLLVVRYAPDGTLLWHDVTTGLGNIEQVSDVAVDETGNTYALGDLAVPGISFSFHLMKYSPAGVKLWSQSLTHTGGVDRPRAIAIDPEGNIIVAGTGGVGAANDSVLIGKYTPTGQLLWSLAYKGDHFWAAGRALAVDEQGNAYVTGNAAPPGSSDSHYHTIKVDPAGELCWSMTLAGHPDQGTDVANAVAVNNQGDAFVTGGMWLNFHYYYATLKYAASQCAPADLNCDEVVDVLDLLILLDAWGACKDCTECAADFNGDCSVDVLDLLFLLDNWG